MVLAIYQIILHLNKITECLKMTTFKIVFTFDVFVSAETKMHCKVTCILYKKQAHFSQPFCLQVRSVTPWQSHDRKSRCLRGRRHSSILYNQWNFFTGHSVWWTKMIHQTESTFTRPKENRNLLNISLLMAGLYFLYLYEAIFIVSDFN